MRGQYIKLAGVTAPSSLGLPKVSMSAADLIAIKVAQLLHVVSARQMSMQGGVLTGRSRTDGSALTMKGANASTLMLKTLGGKTGIGSSAAASAAGVALPAGSATPSYCAVLTIGLPSDIAAATTTHNFLYSFTSADAAVAAAARFYGPSSSTTSFANKILAGGSDGAAPWAIADNPAGNWRVVVVDFNNFSKTASISVNGGAYATAVDATEHAPGAGGYFSIGYHLGASSLYTALVGDLYLFNDTMLTTAERQVQLAALVAALKADYGITP